MLLENWWITKVPIFISNSPSTWISDCQQELSTNFRRKFDEWNIFIYTSYVIKSVSLFILEMWSKYKQCLANMLRWKYLYIRSILLMELGVLFDCRRSERLRPSWTGPDAEDAVGHHRRRREGMWYKIQRDKKKLKTPIKRRILSSPLTFKRSMRGGKKCAEKTSGSGCSSLASSSFTT